MNIASIQKSHDPVFSILDLATDEAIGRGMLFDIHRVNRCAEIPPLFAEKKTLWYYGEGRWPDMPF